MIRRSATARTRTALIAVAACLVFVLLAATVGGFLAKHHLRKNRESQLQGLLSMRSFSWKELHQATNGFEKLLGKGSFGEVYEGRMKSPQQQLIAVKRLINWNESSEKGVRQRGAVHRADPPPEPGPHDRVYCKEGKHRMLVLEFMP